MARHVIAIDIDDVIAAGSEGFAEFSNAQWGGQLTGDHYDEDFAKAWGVSLEEALARVEIYLQSGAHGRFRRFNDALPVLKALAGRFDLVVVTSRREQLKPETDAWINRHFPGLFQRIVYAGIFDKKNASIHHKLKHTKTEILRELQATYLIDDQPKHCFAAAGAGITSILFGDYRWNRDLIDLPQGVVRAKNWAAVGRYFHV